MLGDEIETSSRGSSAVEDEVIGTHPFLLFNDMEELFDKLTLLNYGTEFVKNARIRPLNRHYFALQTNPGEQFFIFASLAAWLLQKCGKYMDSPQEYDDPNSTIAVIIDISRDLDITVDFSPNKLKQGFGKQVIYILNCLADKALRRCSFNFSRPIPPVEIDDEEPVIEDDAELLLDRIEEEMAAEEFESDDDEDNLLRIEDLNKLNIDSQRVEDVLESTTNVDEWQLELERVLPLLKVTVKSDSRDWRCHLEQIKTYRDTIKDTMKVAKPQVDKVIGDISDTMEKIISREKFLNSALEDILNKYRSVLSELSKHNEHYNELNGGIIERQKKMAKITDELESAKQEMETRGTSMSDGTPLVKIKKAITLIKTDIAKMDVQIGVLNHDILQAKLKDKLRIQQSIHAEVFA